ncbi:hypothetical protein Vadar_025701 [Vaccinium darrowii]|uniref:Uncharacterized protein n=1 Tax=Vaccinium darrowii TaxID=229202 RepID=A0ACB7YAI2_9ERIC|nr:hypothetical protein Vadar_025701 [Vaccinium darrowii]
MITLPLYAEQRMNATQLAEEVGVVVKPMVEPGKEVVGREEIERVARLVMEGDGGKVIRHRAKELRDSARIALDSGMEIGACEGMEIGAQPNKNVECSTHLVELVLGRL